VPTLWLGRWYLFQTFEELDSVKDKQAEIKEIRHVIDDANSTGIKNKSNAKGGL
jgi:hypothetical protein